MQFDDYCHLVRDANVNFVLTRRAESAWDLRYLPGNSVMVQFGSDGGASVADGIVRPDALILICMRNPVDFQIALNGMPICFEDIGILPPNSHFVFAAPGPRTWFSVALPTNSRLEFAKYQSHSNRQHRAPGILRDEFRLKKQLASLVRCYERATLGMERARIEAELIETAVKILQKFRDREQIYISRATQSAFEEVEHALKSLDPDAGGEHWRMAKLASAAGVSTRTLHRAFNVVLGMGPTRFLNLRRLNLIRREIRSGQKGRRIADIIFASGTAQAGRVAGEYKKLFGQLPSETARVKWLIDQRE